MFDFLARPHAITINFMRDYFVSVLFYPAIFLYLASPFDSFFDRVFEPTVSASHGTAGMISRWLLGLKKPAA